MPFLRSNHTNLHPSFFKLMALFVCIYICMYVWGVNIFFLFLCLGRERFLKKNTKKHIIIKNVFFRFFFSKKQKTRIFMFLLRSRTIFEKNQQQKTLPPMYVCFYVCILYVCNMYVCMYVCLYVL